MLRVKRLWLQATVELNALGIDGYWQSIKLRGMSIFISIREMAGSKNGNQNSHSSKTLFRTESPNS